MIYILIDISICTPITRKLISIIAKQYIYVSRYQYVITNLIG